MVAMQQKPRRHVVAKQKGGGVSFGVARSQAVPSEDGSEG